MALAAYVTSFGLGTGSGNPVTSNVTVPTTTNPCLIYTVGLDSITESVTSVSWSLGGGTAVNVTSKRDPLVTTAYQSMWVIPNVTPGSGTLLIGKSSTGVAHQINVAMFSNTHTSTPCPAADSDGYALSESSSARTPANLTSSDASYGMGINTVADTPTSVSPIQVYLNTNTSINAEAGYNTGTTGVTYQWDTPNGGRSILTARIVGLAGGGATTASALYFRADNLSGIGASGRFFQDPLQ